MEVFCTIISNYSLVLIVVTSLHLINWHSDRLEMVSFLIASLLNVFLMCILKLIYSEPRPYMSNPLIRLSECSVEYGNPSGHSLICAFYFFTIIWLYDQNIAIILENGRLNYRRLGLIIITILSILLVAFSRVYLGVHSLNQVVLGIIYGIFTMVLYTQFLAPYFQQLLTNLI